MPESVAEIINQINYNANFGFNKDELQNIVAENDNKACSKYKANIDDHIDRVAEVWFQDTGIEEMFTYAPSSIYVHKSPMPLRTIAKNEFGVSDTLLGDIDDLIRTHDRSRLSEDEFYAAANHFFGTNDANAFNISLLKHYQRNAHEFGHYRYTTETSSTVLINMPEPYIWQRIAVWLANYKDQDYVYNTNYGVEPFKYYWGHGYNTEYIWVYYEYYGWVKVRPGDPTMPSRAPMGTTAQSRFKQIIYHWEHYLPDPI